jgi:hypothetical protein
MLGIISLIGCYDPNAQQSAIVRRVEAAGAGDLSTFDALSLGTWFANRPTLATEISTACQQRQLNATASWGRSSEGTVCRAAMMATPAPEPLADRSRAW